MLLDLQDRICTSSCSPYGGLLRLGASARQSLHGARPVDWVTLSTKEGSTPVSYSPTL